MFELKTIRNKNLVVFLLQERVIYENLDQLRQRSKEIKDKIDDTEERLGD